MSLTVETLEDLCGYGFDESEMVRAQAIITLVSTAAEGIIGASVDENVSPAVTAAITSSCLRYMHNQSGASTETIGGFTAQYSNAGRLFSNEELLMLRSAKTTRVGTINLRVPSAVEETEEG